ncbi:hypothetical protein SAMN05421810_106226 [Amycolatopsis arida]|uniref:Uncharacterized protein n=1 Tax=Amycolatopsis arida TaxID=587909 RepID=A0A1I5XSA1_9PSEU|nr:hypothetical protein CLV69_102396 [Amycolatopsis arida]SFQ34790.1 hypothetical protein SAMN05421810_106226 [Amycolatopsis arida]
MLVVLATTGTAGVLLLFGLVNRALGRRSGVAAGGTGR